MSSRDNLIIIFDLGGVLVDWNPRYLYRSHFNDEASMERFLAEVLTAEWNLEMDAGKPFRQAVAERSALHPQYAELIALWHTHWPHTLHGAIEGSVDILHTLMRQGRRLVALSNWSAETFPLARQRFDFLSCFEDIVVSGEHGMAKPDARIFEFACQRWNVTPAQALFIDDNAANIASARAMGFGTVHFTSPAALAQSLRDLGIAV